MAINSILIRNFRSIANLNEKMRNMNIFVGQNDDGKSNILRALDLFFNDTRDGGYEFDWSRDFCCFAPRRERKAEEIVIELEIAPPRSFANRVPVLWRKIWRNEGFYRETLKHKDGTAVKKASKIEYFLKAIRFDYVPAIKGKHYWAPLKTSS